MSEQTPSPEPAADPLDEQLVAYLDGELDSGAARRVEQAIAADAAVRDRLRRLERSWALLDRLDRGRAGPAFAQSTLEIAAVAAERDLAADRQDAPRRRRRQWLLGILLVAGALLAGLAVGPLFRPDPDRALIENLPLIDDLNEYSRIDGVAFLRLLCQRGLFQEGDEEPGTAELDYAARRDWLAALGAEGKLQLQRKLERFEALEAGRREELRELYGRIEADPDAPRLRHAMQHYYDWLRTLSPRQQSDLADLAVEARVERIEALLAQQSPSGAKKPGPRRPPRHAKPPSSSRLSKQDVEGLIGWIDERVKRGDAKILEILPAQQRREAEDELRRLKEPIRRHQFLALLWLRVQLDNRGENSLLTDEDLKGLRGRLSPSTQKRLASQSPAQQWQSISRMVPLFALLQQRSQGGEAADPSAEEQELIDFFERELTDKQRQQLTQLPYDEIPKELWRMYFLWKVPGGSAREQGKKPPAAPAKGTGRGPAPGAGPSAAERRRSP